MQIFRKCSLKLHFRNCCNYVSFALAFISKVAQNKPSPDYMKENLLKRGIICCSHS